MANRGVVHLQTDPLSLRMCLRGADSEGSLGVVELVLEPGTVRRYICTQPTVRASTHYPGS